MTGFSIPVPGPDEYAPFYAGYVASVAHGALTELLERQVETLRELCGGLPGDAGDYRYAPGKWSVKQILGHVGDVERVFAYRLLRISRGDSTPLAGFEENAYVEAAGFERRTVGDLMDELELLRASTLTLMRHVPAVAWARRGVASGAEVTARALAYIIAGHMQHHTAILRDRYGLGKGSS